MSAKDTALNKQQKRILELFKENKQLETNWKELKKWLEENRFVYNITGEDLEEDYSITEVLNKMQEIEKSVSDEIFL